MRIEQKQTRVDVQTSYSFHTSVHLKPWFQACKDQMEMWRNLIYMHGFLQWMCTIQENWYYKNWFQSQQMQIHEFVCPNQPRHRSHIELPSWTYARCGAPLGKRMDRLDVPILTVVHEVHTTASNPKKSCSLHCRISQMQILSSNVLSLLLDTHHVKTVWYPVWVKCHTLRILALLLVTNSEKILIVL